MRFKEMGQNKLYPVFLKLEELQTLIVGGGNVGAEKLGAILKSSPLAKVTLVADFISDEVRELAEKHTSVRMIQRKFIVNDLDGKDLVILATDNRQLHESIKKETSKRHIITNVADTPDLCDFYLGSVVQKGDLKIGISTNGKSPTMSKRIREFLEYALPEETQSLLDNLKAIRDKLGGDFRNKVIQLNKITSSLSQNK